MRQPADRHLERINSVVTQPAQRYLHVHIPSQTLRLLENGTVRGTWTISTSRYGTGSIEGSDMTPEGVHAVVEKIGDGAPEGRIFRSRVDTGVDYTPGTQEDNLICTRILRLRGLEPGINSGPGIDSYERYIYIHGTNREDLVGTPMSHGCVCMRNRDIIDLFNSVQEGTIVYIDKG
jgi:lipoprotein-anchoring transpeptidase ErfK/SrfK